MKKIIPFVKELNFKTKVSEITSISLEHNITLKDSDLISGVFHINGDYKMTDASINREEFDFNLPFDIALDSRYDIKNSKIDIDNFYYEIINNDILKVHIDLYIEKIKELEEPKEEKEKIRLSEIDKENNQKEEAKEKEEEIKINKEEREIKEDLVGVTRNSKNEETKETTKEEKEDISPSIIYEKKKIETIKEDTRNENNDNKEEESTNNIFNSFDNNDTYASYYVYIVKENDTIDTILKKYEIEKEELASYNDLENITKGTKLIIPSSNEK